eukprot:scaffold367723_cov17-Prasinocladus_malaysianus.AAC.1
MASRATYRCPTNLACKTATSSSSSHMILRQGRISSPHRARNISSQCDMHSRQWASSSREPA